MNISAWPAITVALIAPCCRNVSGETKRSQRRVAIDERQLYSQANKRQPENNIQMWKFLLNPPSCTWPGGGKVHNRLATPSLDFFQKFPGASFISATWPILALSSLIVNFS